jgi:hypothetical protein
MDHLHKSALLEQYLKQQETASPACQATPSEAGSSIYGGRRLEQALVETPDNSTLEEFKHQVKLWMEIDNQIKKLAQISKEKKGVQKVLSEKILAFMARFNIEDLNTKEGKLRYKVTQVKPKEKKEDVKQKLMNYFEHDRETGKKVIDAVFPGEKEQPKVEKVTLRRLKGVRVLNM